MEEERFFSGYCRQLDNHRMVEAILKEGKLQEVDCAFGNCAFQAGCPIGKQLQVLTEE